MSGIPEEWETSTVGSISSDISYGFTAKSTNRATETRYLRITDIQDGSVNWNKVPFCKIDESKKNSYLLQTYDILFARTGATVGKSFLIHETIPETVCASYLIRVRTFYNISTYYVYHFFKSSEYWNQISESSSGIGQPNVNGTKLKALKLPIPSFSEQNEIVSRLERLLGQVDGIKKRIDGIPAILKSFRQSVLSAAVSGKLTEEWRGENQFNTIKNIRVLNIAERKKMQKYKHPKKLESKIHIILDSTWQLISMDEACIKITDGTHHSPKSFSEGDYMYVTSKNVREGYIDLKNITYVDTATHIEIYSRCDVIKGDVLFVKDGANTGLACVNNIEEKISLLSSVGVLRTTSYVVPKFLEFYLNSPFTRRIMYSMMGGTAIKRLTLTKIMSLPFPLPPLEEQKEIVKRVESAFALADALELKIKEAQKRVDHLTQSILAKAFCGDLTKEWRELNRELITGENSAFALLERIKKERETLKTKTGRKRIKS